MRSINESNKTSGSNQDLLDYIKSAIELETDIETQKLIMQDYDTCRDAVKPQLRHKRLPAEPAYVDEDPWSKKTVENVGVAVMGTLVLGPILPLLLGIKSAAAIGISAIGVPAIAVAIAYASYSEERKSRKKTNADYLRQYNEEATRIEEENENLRSIYASNLQKWEDTNAAMYVQFQKQLSASMNVLNKFYDLDFIYPKYRTLPALTSIYEYFMTGRCSTLEGPNGAYNLYENELRMNTVISQLNTIIENLEAIKQNQYMLYQQVKEMKETVQSIHQEVSSIRGYTIEIATLTALNAYYSSITARNARIMTLYHLL